MQDALSAVIDSCLILSQLFCPQSWCAQQSWHSVCRESPTALLYQKAPYSPLFVVAIPSQKLTLIPPKHICHFKSISPRDVLLYHNNLFAFSWTAVHCPGFLCCWNNHFPFQKLSYFSIWCFCKNSPWELPLCWCGEFLTRYLLYLTNAGPVCFLLSPAASISVCR